MSRVHRRIPLRLGRILLIFALWGAALGVLSFLLSEALGIPPGIRPVVSGAVVGTGIVIANFVVSRGVATGRLRWLRRDPPTS